MSIWASHCCAPRGGRDRGHPPPVGPRAGLAESPEPPQESPWWSGSSRQGALPWGQVQGTTTLAGRVAELTLQAVHDRAGGPDQSISSLRWVQTRAC